MQWIEGANGYRLPTEAQWEYCAKAGVELLYSGSDSADEVAWHDANTGYLNPTPVAQKKPNAWGFFDMSGNVWEWVWDSALRMYILPSAVDPVNNDTTGIRRVHRGGSSMMKKTRMRLSARRFATASYRDAHLGFRILKS